MNRQIRKLSLAALSVSLCACSMLGERKDSTRLDIDQDSLPQIKVLSKSTSGSDSVLTADNSGKDPFKVVNLTTKYLHPSLDASKVVRDKKIGLLHVMQEEVDGEKKSLPPEIDTASLFFGLGGKITGDLDIIENPDDDLKELIKFDETAAQTKREEMIQKNPSCEGHITDLFAQGQVQFDLSQTQISDLAANTINEGKSLSADVENEIKEELAKRDPSKADDPIDVTEKIFGNLSSETQKNIRALFKPDVGLFFLVETKHFSICIPESRKDLQAYLLDKNGLQSILPENVKIEESADGLIVTIRTIRQNVTKSDLDQIKLAMKGQEDESIPFGQLKFGDKEVPVFSSTHNEVTEYTFHVNLPKKESAEQASDNPDEPEKKDETTPPSDSQTGQVSEVTTAVEPSNKEPVTVEHPSKHTLPIDQKTKVQDDILTPVMPARSDSTFTKRLRRLHAAIRFHPLQRP
ncbi:MAG: hypothetical protein R2877_02780 [Bdellovibrionota bacterium]